MYAHPPRYVDGLPRPPRCLVMGVLNVTPDSFSDGGQYLDRERAVAHGIELARYGADLVDVGGESTRPGAVRPSVDEELDRVVPVVERLAGAGIGVSVDTMRAVVAEAAVAAGAVLVNDVSGGRADENGELRPPLERDDATTATTALAAAAGAWCVRAHDARATADAVRVVARWAAARGESSVD